MSKKKIDDRKIEEATEGYKTVKTDLPSDRFQADKQIVPSADVGITPQSKPGDVANTTSASAAKQLRASVKVKPDVSVEDLGDKQIGGVPLAVQTTLRNAAGARNLSPADDMSRTSYSPGEYRPATRFAKKRSEDLFEIDNTAIEQVVPTVEDLPDLREAPDKSVGYNGRQQFKQTRQKKNYSYTNGDGHDVGKLPQQLLNDASVDFVDVDQLVYTSGQIVNPINEDGTVGNLPASADYPTFDGDLTLEGDDVMHKSNYVPVSLEFTVANGHLTDVRINEDKYVAAASATVRDEANLNWQVDANNVAKTMVKIQTEMGRETTDKWTPLAYVIHDPYEYNMLLHDIESSTGAIMATAYRSAVSSLAYQRNILKKDGINPQRNAIKMIVEGYLGDLANNDANTISDLGFDHMIWNQAEYRKGSAAALIHMFDSTGKYRTKADLLGMQRSLGMHLAQADNNLNPLHCKKSFIQALNKAHMFSTLDGTYNPYLPIFQTKRIKLCNPLSLNRFLNGWKNPALLTVAERSDARRDITTGTYAQYSYSYRDLRNTYTTRVQHPLVEGLLKWMLKHEGALVSTFGQGTTTIPFYFHMQNPSLLSFMLCSAAQDVLYERNICFRDVLFAGEQSTYIWDDLAGLDALNPLYSTQLTINKYDEPLSVGKMAPDTAIRMFYSSHKQLSDHTNGNVQYFEPWHFNEQSLRNVAGGEYVIRSGFFDDNLAFNFSFPSIRAGVRHEFVDLIKSMDPKDVMLCLDRQLDFLKYTQARQVELSYNPGRVQYVEYTPYCAANVNNQKVKLNAVRYDGNSDGRVVSKYLLDEGADLNLFARGMYCIPKEIGFIDDYYFGTNIITALGYAGGAVTSTVISDSFDSTDTSGRNVDFYNGSKAISVTSYRVEQGSGTNGSVDRSAALTSTFRRFFACGAENRDITAVNNAFIADTGLVLTRSYQDGATITVPGVYNIRSNNEATQSIDNNIVTDSQFVWTVLQRFFMPVNPFANAYSVNNNHNYDPFETSFWFGVCGFLAADYTEHVNDRLSVFDQLNMDYTEDTNIKDSLIFR